MMRCAFRRSVSARRLLVRIGLLCCLGGSWSVTCRAQDDDGRYRPKLEYHQPGIKLTVVAEQPDVVTPTGIDVAADGTVWVISSHTHFRPDDYEGPAHDEVVVLHPDGRRSVFYARTDATMDLELGPEGWVYLAERDRILRIQDTDGDGQADVEQNLAVLETEADYPHNGLAGIAWHPSGDLMFSLGENYWKEWTLTGTDGRRVSGTGEGGIFRCSADGRQLRRVARGFWNPFGLLVRDDGDMFAAENDPGARPPCRLLHVVEGGDYGYQRLYGNAPFHPFVAWDGELRGTLPMLHAVAEAPCGVVPLGGGLLIGSWSDNRLDFYSMKRDGAGFAARQVPLVRAAELFRPTCIAQASETTFYMADWVWGTYNLHDRGRVWKIEIDPDQAEWWDCRELQPLNEETRLARDLRAGRVALPFLKLLELAQSTDPYLADAAVQNLALRAAEWPVDLPDRHERGFRLALLQARRRAVPHDEAWITRALQDPSTEVRFEALRWLTDQQLTDFLPAVQEMLRRPDLDYRLFEACLAAHNTLTGNPRAGIEDPGILLQTLTAPQTPTSIQAFTLRLLPPKHTGLTLKLLSQKLDSDDVQLQREVVRTLSARGDESAAGLLLEIATAAARDEQVRADAIAGLAAHAGRYVNELAGLAAADNAVLRHEALRALRFAAPNEALQAHLAAIAEKHPDCRELVAAIADAESLKADRPDLKDLTAWLKLIDQADSPGDPNVGRRIFHHSKVGLCANCHRHWGRGNVVGPDLTVVASTGDRRKILQSLLEPSRDVDPQYYPQMIVTTDGKTFTGIMLRKGGRTSREYYRDAQGQEQSFPWAEIEFRKDLKTSLMPEGLPHMLTIQELRDLLAFLEQDARQ